jgi:hypothetical protein
MIQPYGLITALFVAQIDGSSENQDQTHWEVPTQV